MVALLDAGLPVSRTLHWQDVEGRLSRVRPVSCPVDPLRRCVRADLALPAGRLPSLQGLLEWAYGYRAAKTRGRATRRAPSAGALYPTETLVVADDGDGWQVLTYHYASHRFYRVPTGDGPAAARRLELAPGDACVLCAAVLWRTLQRYGVRGYRYCLLDAAHVAANLARAARAFGHEAEVDPGAPATDLEGLLGLEDGEALLLAVHCRPGADPLPVAMPPALAELPQAAGVSEQTPLMSPVLHRALRFHRQTLGAAGGRVPWPAGGESPHDLDAWAAGRCSAKEFTGAHVSARLYARLAAVARAPQVLREHAPELRVCTVTARVWGLPVGVGPLDAEATPGWLMPGPPPPALTRALADSCQGQALLNSCAFCFAIGARTAELAALGHRAFRPLVLNAGFLCAELYREAARCGLGTTSIGGFSDAAVARLVGEPGLTPIVVQAFGAAAAGTEKADAARIVRG